MASPAVASRSIASVNFDMDPPRSCELFTASAAVLGNCSHSEGKARRKGADRAVELVDRDVGAVFGPEHLRQERDVGAYQVAHPGIDIGLPVPAAVQEEGLGAAVAPLFVGGGGEQVPAPAQSELAAHAYSPQLVSELRHAGRKLAFAATVSAGVDHGRVAGVERVAVGGAEHLAVGVADALRRIAQLRVLCEERHLPALVVGMLPLRNQSLGVAIAVIVELERLELSAHRDRVLSVKPARAEAGVERQPVELVFVPVTPARSGGAAHERPGLG